MVLHSRAAYALWAEFYPPHAHNPLMEAEEAAMRALLPDLRGRDVLDLACGTGRYAHIALAMGARSVIGLDDSLAMLAQGQRSGRPGLRLACATLDRLPLGRASIDVVVCGLAVGHVAGLAAPFSEIARILRPGGCAIVSDFHPLLSLTGAERTFTHDGRTFAVAHHTHLYADVFDAANQAGLTIDAVREPRLTINKREMPVAIVYRLCR